MSMNIAIDGPAGAGTSTIAKKLAKKLAFVYAQVKIYLTASVATRAKRRYDELTAKGTQCNLEEIEKDIEDRDYRDMHRETSPLKQAKDAVLVDSSEMNIDEVVDAIYQIYARV